MAGHIDYWIDAVTGIAGYRIFDPPQLDHHSDSEPGWEWLPWHFRPAVEQGSLIAFHTGSDGTWRLRLTDGDPTPAERARFGPRVDFPFRVTRERFCLDNGDKFPNTARFDDPEDFPEQWVSAPNGEYRVSVIAIRRFDDAGDGADPDELTDFLLLFRPAPVSTTPVPPGMPELRRDQESATFTRLAGRDYPLIRGPWPAPRPGFAYPLMSWRGVGDVSHPRAEVPDIRRMPVPHAKTPVALPDDDWSWMVNERYGRYGVRVVLVDDRAPGSPCLVAHWTAGHYQQNLPYTWVSGEAPGTILGIRSEDGLEVVDVGPPPDPAPQVDPWAGYPPTVDLVRSLIEAGRTVGQRSPGLVIADDAAYRWAAHLDTLEELAVWMLHHWVVPLSDLVELIVADTDERLRRMLNHVAFRRVPVPHPTDDRPAGPHRS